MVAAVLLGTTPACADAEIASWYGSRAHEGRLMADGCRFHARAATAAHRSLPLGTWISVINRRNGRAIEVEITDRGPFVPGRVLDLSHAAAVRLGFVAAGLAPVRFTVLGARPSGCHAK